MLLTTENLPEPAVMLPKGAQSIWLSIFNSTYRTFAGSDQEKQQASLIAAWAAVRSKFAQDPETGDWMQKSAISFDDPHGIHGRWTRAVKFSPNLLEATKRITYGEVYAPWTVDAQGDFADEGTIEDAAHNFLKHFATIGEQHRLFGGKGAPVESFTSRAKDGDFPIPGTWVLGTQWSEEMWQKILNGEITGYSLGGDWTRMPLVAGREYAKQILAGGKSADAPAIAELDDALFEDTVNAGPRIISQIVGLMVDEVSGVSLPANRAPFKLFKGGGPAMATRTVVVGSGKGGKCACEEPGVKASPASPFIKLYENYIESGMTPEQARAEVERVLGPAPPGTWDTVKGKDATDQCVAGHMADPHYMDKFPDEQQRLAVAFSDCQAGKSIIPKKEKAMETHKFADVVVLVDQKLGEGNGVPVASLLQAKYAGPGGGIVLPEGKGIDAAIDWAVEQGTTAGIFAIKAAAPVQEQTTLLKQIQHAIKSVAQRLGVTAEGQGEDEAMTAQEKQEFDALKAMVTEKCAAFEKRLSEAAPAAAAPAAPAVASAEPEKGKELAPAVAAAAPAPKGGDGEYQPTPGELELHNRVKELEATIQALRARPGTSDVAEVQLAPETVEAGKSVNGGYRYSSILGTPVSISASAAAAAADADRMKRKQERRNSYGNGTARAR